MKKSADISDVLVMESTHIILGEICAIKATNRDVLISKINQYIETFFFDGSKDKIYLRIELGGQQLGHIRYSADYPTEADVPSHSVPCPCGNPNHWMIKYGEEL